MCVKCGIAFKSFFCFFFKGLDDDVIEWQRARVERHAVEQEIVSTTVFNPEEETE